MCKEISCCTCLRWIYKYINIKISINHVLHVLFSFFNVLSCFNKKNNTYCTFDLETLVYCRQFICIDKQDSFNESIDDEDEFETYSLFLCVNLIRNKMINSSIYQNDYLFCDSICLTLYSWLLGTSKFIYLIFLFIKYCRVQSWLLYYEQTRVFFIWCIIVEKC